MHSNKVFIIHFIFVCVNQFTQGHELVYEFKFLVMFQFSLYDMNQILY